MMENSEIEKIRELVKITPIVTVNIPNSPVAQEFVDYAVAMINSVKPMLAEIDRLKEENSQAVIAERIGCISTLKSEINKQASNEKWNPIGFIEALEERREGMKRWVTCQGGFEFLQTTLQELEDLGHVIFSVSVSESGNYRSFYIVAYIEARGEKE